MFNNNGNEYMGENKLLKKTMEWILLGRSGRGPTKNCTEDLSKDMSVRIMKDND